MWDRRLRLSVERSSTSLSCRTDKLRPYSKSVYLYCVVSAPSRPFGAR